MACECCDQPPAGFGLLIRRGGNVIFGGETIEEAWNAVVDFDWEEDGDPALEWGEWGAVLSESVVDPAISTALEFVVGEARKEGVLNDVGEFGGFEAELIKGQYRFAWHSGTAYVKITFDAVAQHRLNEHEGVWETDFTESREFTWNGTGIDDDFIANDIDTWPLSSSQTINIGEGTPELPTPNDPVDPVTSRVHETRVLIRNLRFSFVSGHSPSGSQLNGFPEP